MLHLSTQKQLATQRKRMIRDMLKEFDKLHHEMWKLWDYQARVSREASPMFSASLFWQADLLYQARRKALKLAGETK